MADLKDISIISYLEALGVVVRKQGHLHFCSSPFSRDSEWSFCIYPTNTFYDWSSGIGGNIITLHSKLKSKGGALNYKQLFLNGNTAPPPHETNYVKPTFNIQKYINTNQHEEEAIIEYAKTRGIKRHFTPGVFFEQASGQNEPQAKGDEVKPNKIQTGSGHKPGGHGEKYNLIRVPAVGFVHVDKSLNICGIKLRRLNNNGKRFAARGKLGFYILKTDVDPKQIYIIEGESNANSLFEILAPYQPYHPVVVLSHGGVSRKLTDIMLPEAYKSLPKNLIIDYDGNSATYNERLSMYEGLSKLNPITLVLPKGEDVNSIYAQNKSYLLKSLILNIKHNY